MLHEPKPIYRLEQSISFLLRGHTIPHLSHLQEAFQEIGEYHAYVLPEVYKIQLRPNEITPTPIYSPLKYEIVSALKKGAGGTGAAQEQLVPFLSRISSASDILTQLLSPNPLYFCQKMVVESDLESHFEPK